MIPSKETQALTPWSDEWLENVAGEIYEEAYDTALRLVGYGHRDFYPILQTKTESLWKSLNT